MEKINLSVQRSFSDLITVTINFMVYILDVFCTKRIYIL